MDVSSSWPTRGRRQHTSLQCTIYWSSNTPASYQGKSNFIFCDFYWFRQVRGKPKWLRPERSKKGKKKYLAIILGEELNARDPDLMMPWHPWKKKTSANVDTLSNHCASRSAEILRFALFREICQLLCNVDLLWSIYSIISWRYHLIQSSSDVNQCIQIVFII